jgi:hypothetical protein
MADEKDKTAVETTASNKTGSTSSMDIFNNALAAGGIYQGKGADGKDKTVGLDEWTKKWFAMSETQRQEWVNKFNALGKKVNVVTGIDEWVAYGRKSIQYYQQGGKFTPDELIAMDAKQGVGSGISYTSQDAKALVQSTYQSLLGRDATGGEYEKAFQKAMTQSSSTGAGGRQQAVVDFIKSSDEYDSRQENKYLDAIYNELAGEMREVKA